LSTHSDDRPFDFVERLSLWSSAICLVGMGGLMLLEVILRLDRHGKRIAVTNAHGPVRRVLDVTGMWIYLTGHDAP